MSDRSLMAKENEKNILEFFHSGRTAVEFALAHKLTSVQLEDAIVSISLDDMNEKSIISSIEKLSKFISFVSEVRKELKIQPPDYKSMIYVTLDKVVDAPASAYEFHDINNKLNIKESKIIGGLLYK